jgi:hypothetical protein
MIWISNWNKLKNFHQISYELYAFGGPSFFLKFDLLDQKFVEQLRCNTRASMQVIQLEWERTELKIRYLLTTLHIPTFSFLQFTSSNVAIQLIWPPCYQTCTIRTAHITVQVVWKWENTLANFGIRGSEALRLYIQMFMYMQDLS